MRISQHLFSKLSTTFVIVLLIVSGEIYKGDHDVL